MNIPIEGCNLMRYRNFARNASAKQIKKFIKSLDIRLLKKMIEIYTESILSISLKELNIGQLSAMDTLRHWKTKQNENTVTSDHHELDGFHPDDIKILQSLKKYCFNKRATMYQRQSKLLNTLPMDIISYSLSFLTFKELSKTERTSLYFITASRTYCNISHFHLQIDFNFIYSTASNQLNLNLLTHFKSIHITTSPGRGSITMFLFTMKKIMQRSESSLKSLTIDVNRVGRKYCLLKKILDYVSSFPSLNTVRWLQDHQFRSAEFQNFDDKALMKSLRTKVPQLQHLEIAAATKRSYYHQLPSIKFVESILNPLDENRLYLKIKSLDLTATELFSSNIIPTTLNNIKNLNHLSIVAHLNNSMLIHQEIQNNFVPTRYLDGNARVILTKYKPSFMNTCIKTLILKITSTHVHTNQALFNILVYFFVHCVNVTHLTLEVYHNYACNNVQWSLLFDLLMEQKTKYGSSFPLCSLEIRSSVDTSLSVLNGYSKALSIQRNLKYLKSIHLNLSECHWRALYNNLFEFDKLIHGSICVLRQCVEDNDTKLQSFKITMPSLYKSLDIDVNLNNYVLPVHDAITYSTLFRHLKVVNLDYICDLFHSNLIPTILRNAQHLMDLSIYTVVPKTTQFALDFKKDFVPMACWEWKARDIVKQHQTSFCHYSLKKLNLRLSYIDHDDVERYSMQCILSYFYFICPNITHLSVSLSHGKYGSNPLLFDLLSAHKAQHNTEPLSALTVKGNDSLLMQVLKGLSTSDESEHLRKYLKRIELQRDTRQWQWGAYEASVLLLLQYIPGTVECFILDCSSAHVDIKSVDISWKIVKCLVDMDVNDQMNIQSIALKNVSLPTNAIKYLYFYFGYQNRLLYDEQNTNFQLTFTP